MATGKATVLYAGVVAYGAAGGVGLEFAALAGVFYAVALPWTIASDISEWSWSKKDDDEDEDEEKKEQPSSPWDVIGKLLRGLGS